MASPLSVAGRADPSQLAQVDRPTITRKFFRRIICAEHGFGLTFAFLLEHSECPPADLFPCRSEFLPPYANGYYRESLHQQVGR